MTQSHCGDYNQDPSESSESCTPTHPPCEHRDKPCKSCNELTEIEAEIEDFHSRLKNLHERHRQARATRNLVHNGPWIRQLPSETVAHIFVLAFPPREPFNCHNPGKEVNPLILAKVCQTWRELAFSTPSLWSHISVDAKEPNFPLMKHKVAHSGEMPLSIHLYYIPNPSTVSKEAMSFVVKQLHRTSSLCTNLPGKILNEFSSIVSLDTPKAAPVLEELHVHCKDEERSFQLRLASELIRPRRVVFEWLSYHQVLLDWTKISNLTLKSCFAGVPLSGVVLSTDLKHLILGGDGDLTHQELVVYPSVKRLTLASLRSAEFVFTKTSLPSLQNLEIKVEEKLQLYPMICDFLQQSQCPLQVLIIHHWGQDTTETAGETSMQALTCFLENTKSLQHLTLEAYEGYPASSPRPLLQRLLLRETCFLPCLQTLSLRTRYTLPIDLLLNLMTTAEDGGRPLHKLNLEFWMTFFDVGAFSRDEVLKILELRAAGKSISIGCGLEWGCPELVSDVVKYWKCKYDL